LTNTTDAAQAPTTDERVVLPGRARVTLAHTRAQVLELTRTPIAIISTTIFPTMAFLFFVLPQQEVTRDPIASLVVVAQLGMFGVMSSYLFGYGIGVAEDRANPWSSYLRTLPVGPLPTTLARFFTAALSAVLSLIPLIVAVAVLTRAGQAFTSGQLPWARIALALGAIVVAGLPFLGVGLTIGYSMSSKAAVAVAQVVNFPLAFLGGLLLPPEMFPDWLGQVSLSTPSRAARDVVVSALIGAPMPASTVWVLSGWTSVMLGLALWTNRRDQGRRFR